MARQASAHFRELWAQVLQCSWSCCSQFSAQRSQALAHSSQASFENGPSLASSVAHARQAAAQSMQQAGQSFMLSLPAIMARQWSQSAAQERQVWMQSACFMGFLRMSGPSGPRCVTGYPRWGTRSRFIERPTLRINLMAKKKKKLAAGAAGKPSRKTAAKKSASKTPEHTVCVDDEHKADVDRRLRRIEGQVRGIQQMIKDDRYCVDVLAQVSAVNAGMRMVARKTLRHHLRHCVRDAMTRDPDLLEQTIEELLEVYHKQGGG